MNVNELIDSILMPLGIDYYCEQPEVLTLPSEHIVYHRIYGNERNFADGRPINNYHLYRINFYCTDKKRIHVVMGNIKNAMKAAGFYLQTDNTTIPREANAKYWGTYSEFAYWEVVINEI